MVSAVTVSSVVEAANIAPTARRVGLGTENFLSWMGGGRGSLAATWGADGVLLPDLRTAAGRRLAA
jgi:hypothetical protein